MPELESARCTEVFPHDVILMLPGVRAVEVRGELLAVTQVVAGEIRLAVGHDVSAVVPAWRFRSPLQGRRCRSRGRRSKGLNRKPLAAGSLEVEVPGMPGRFRCFRR